MDRSSSPDAAQGNILGESAPLRHVAIIGLVGLVWVVFALVAVALVAGSL
jgi:hypothetical protein